MLTDDGELVGEMRVLGARGAAAAAIPCVLLPAILLGEEATSRTTTALGERREDLELGGLETVVRSGPAGRRLTGAKPLVPFAIEATELVVAAEHEGGAVLVRVGACAAGVSIRPRPTIGRNGTAEVRFDGVSVDAPVRIADERWARATVVAALASAAAALGMQDRLLELCVEQGRTRRQFGVPVGSFQSFQHACAEMAMERELASVLVERAAATGEEDDALRARAFCGEAAVRAARSALQLNGGRAYLDDHPVSALYRQAKEAELRWGSVRWARTRLRDGAVVATPNAK